MSNMRVFDFDCFDEIDEEPHALKINQNDDYSCKMEDCSLKHKGNIKHEDLENFCGIKTTSKSLPLIDSKRSTLELNNHCHKRCILHHNSDTTHLSCLENDLKASFSKNDTKLGDKHCLDCETRDVKGFSMRTSMKDEIKHLLHRLSQMHNTNQLDIHIIKEDPADNSLSLNGNKYLEQKDSNYIITMKDVDSPNDE